MKMTKDKFDDRTSKYIWEQLIPDTEGFGTRCAFGAVERSGVLRTGGKLGAVLSTFGILDGDNVDIDKLRNVAYGAAEAGGGKIVIGVPPVAVELPRPALDKYLKFLETEIVT